MFKNSFAKKEDRKILIEENIEKLVKATKYSRQEVINLHAKFLVRPFNFAICTLNS